MLKTFIKVIALLALTAGSAEARVRIDLTNANADPLPIALSDFSAETATGQKIGMQIRNIIENNLRGSGLFNTIDKKAYLQSPESMNIDLPNFAEWRLINAQALMIGHLELIQPETTAEGETPSNKIRLEFRLYDTYGENQLVGKRYTVDSRFWRHIAHRISDDIYANLTGESGYFTTRIVHIGETRQYNGQVRKKLCVMDQDGGNYQCLTDGNHLVLTPRFNPQVQKIIYMSYANGKPRLYLLDLPTGQQEIVGDFEGLNSSPRFTPDGSGVAMTLTKGHAGNPEIYTMDLTTRRLKRITFNSGIDTSPSFSPDGKKIVFNSTRGGKPNLYIMDADGNRVQRLTYGEGKYYAPVWSPRGDLIAFVKNIDGKFSIGVIDPEGEEERQLTESFLDESPSWSPNGRVIIFARQNGDDTNIYTIDLTGYNLKQLKTPTNASDPAWSPLLQ
jgi:TolB protein